MDNTQLAGPKRGEGSGLWILKVLAGLLLVLVLGLHLYVNHLFAPNGLLSWQEVVDYYDNPIIPIIEGLFLLVVLMHGGLGLRSVLLDLNLSMKHRRLMDATLLAVGSALFIYGLWILIKVVSF